MPLTISGSSGTIASTVTPMKYCREEVTSAHAYGLMLTTSKLWATKLLGAWSVSASFPQLLGLNPATRAGSHPWGAHLGPQGHPNLAHHHPHAHLRDGGVGEDGADVLRGQVGTG